MKLNKKEKAIILEALLWTVHGDTDGWDNATKDLAKKLLGCSHVPSRWMDWNCWRKKINKYANNT